MDKSILKKGDQVKFWDNSIGVVLNSGIRGTEFVRKYKKQTVWCFDFRASKVVPGIVTEKDSHSRVIDPGREIVWYYVLRGDQEIWIADTQVNRMAIEKL